MTTLRLTATLKDVSGNPLSGKTVEFYRSTDNVSFSLIAASTTDENGVAEATDEVTVQGTYYYKARFPGDDVYEPSEASASYTYGFEWMQALMDLMNMLMYLVLFILVLSLLISAMREAKRPAEE